MATPNHCPALFTDTLADRLKTRARAPYRPSNGFEGELFMSKWCALCAKDNLDPVTLEGEGCEIIADTMCLDEDDPDYPKAWQYAENGQPICTEFERLSLPPQGCPADGK